MPLKCYRDETANASVIESTADGTLRMYFNNELKAIGNGNGTCSIMNEPKSTDTIDFFEIANISFTEFVDINGASLGSDEATVCNALNAIFQHTGGPSGNVPVITSSLNVNVNDIDQLNYTLTADYAVEYEWDASTLPAGITVSGSNRRKLIGEFTDGAGTYNVDVTAINYFGSDSETITFTVTAVFGNTRSINFENQDWMGANASLVDAVLGRSSNGAGSGDAWTIHMWYKPSSANQGQTVFYFGDNDLTNGGYIDIRQVNASGLKRLRFRYGSNNNRLQLMTTAGTITPGTWHHLLVTYDGGTTGSASGSLSDYYGRFKIYIDGVLQSTTNSHQNYGWSSGIDPDNFRLARSVAGNYLRGARIDEVALWGSDQSGNIADIYNSGNPHDLSELTTSPDHWWRMGDGDTFPNILDNVGNAHFVMYNMTAADIVTDAP